MTEAQEQAIRKTCTQFGTDFDPENYRPGLGMADGWLEGWIGSHIYIGCSPEGEIHS